MPADSYLKYNATENYSAPSSINRSQYNDYNDFDGNYRPFTDNHLANFKQPMAPPLAFGQRKNVPGLISTMCNRKPNLPQQTVNPHYSRFGERSELSNFKAVPDLYPIRPNVSNNHLSQSASSGLVNGHDHSIFSSTKYGSQRFAPDSSTSSILGNSKPFPNNASGNLKTDSFFTNVSKFRKPSNQMKIFMLFYPFY